MNRHLAIVACAVSGLACMGARTQETRPPAPPAPTSPSAPAAPTELTDKAWLYEIVRYLYRWHIDEKSVDAVIASDEVVFWVRELKPRLDEGDRSRFGEVILPQFALAVRVKQADYTIPELDIVVKNPTFRITAVSRVETPAVRPPGGAEVRVNYTELRDELFRTRNRAGFPEGELLERLRAGVRNQLVKEQPDLLKGAPRTQVVYLAPLSPVANETWVFWETGRALIRFASDIDLTNPAVWDREELAVKLYALDKKVVVSLDEVAGSNAFMTRDEAGRALFNCIVLGRRMELTPGEPAAPRDPEKK